MFKKYVVIFTFILHGGITFAQIVMSPNYKAPTLEERLRPIIEYEQTYNQTINSINSLYDFIVDVLGHDIDDQLRQEMNKELKLLDKATENLSKTGDVGNARKDYSLIRRNVQKEIANYNNRVAQERERLAKQEAEKRAKAEQEASLPKNWSGTGFALKNGYVATNYHVIDEAISITIQGVNGDFNKSYTATIVGCDKMNDLALLKISDPSFHGFGTIPYTITSTISEVGEDIFVLGYPLTSTMGDEIKLTTGIISSRTGFKGDVSLYQISAPIQPGNSGGPLFDKKGNIIGVVSAKHTGAENVGYAIKSSYLRNLVESCASASLIPTSNSISTLPLTNKVKQVKNFVFYIRCSSSGGSSTDPLVKSGEFSIGALYGERIISYPSFKSKSAGNITIQSITLTLTETILECSVTTPLNGRMNINRKAYIQTGGTEYKLLAAKDIAYAPEYTYFDCPNQTLYFKLYFQPIPMNSTSLDFLESATSGWRIFGLELK